MPGVDVFAAVVIDRSAILGPDEMPFDLCESVTSAERNMSLDFVGSKAPQAFRWIRLVKLAAGLDSIGRNPQQTMLVSSGLSEIYDQQSKSPPLRNGKKRHTSYRRRSGLLWLALPALMKPSKSMAASEDFEVGRQAQYAQVCIESRPD